MKGAAYIEVAGINASMQESIGTILHFFWSLDVEFQCTRYTVTIRLAYGYADENTTHFR